jgi:Bacterial RNA polymerase, alpha chain C terminal domain
MPIRSPGNVRAGTIRDLGLPPRAVTALAGAGVTTVDDLAVLTRRDLVAINGLGPGLIAAIRRVVPEPPAGVPSSAVPPAPAGEPPASPALDAEAAPAEEESPAAPAIPSFASLRAPRTRTAVDLLVPAATGSAPASAPRPPEYADLLLLGQRVFHAMASVPGRVALWSVREPVRCLRRLLGG